MFDCYGKKLLRIDLTTRQTSTEILPDDFLKKWVGGMGFGTKLLFDEVPATVDPLCPENRIYICVGPLTGTIAPLFAQTCMVTKSPLTGGIINTYAGGFLGGAIKAAGYDVIVLQGRADELTYVLITPEGIELVDCPELQGKSVRETEEAVKKAAGNFDVHTVAIGLAGEKLVRYAAAISETRAFGRGGAGAVFGSKNLKAIGVAGIGEVRVAIPEKFSSAVESSYNIYKEDLSQPWSLLGGFGRTGTGSGMALINEKHALATKYHRQTRFDDAEKIGGEAFAQNYPTRPIACQGCIVHCGMLHKHVSTKWGEVWTRGPEYETAYSLGSLCFNNDPDMLLIANDKAEEFGMDTLSLGVCVAFAMECAERGILRRDVLGNGFSLEFGNADATLRLIDMIAHREGIGNVLAEGTRLASQQIGRDADKFALQVKGMEFAAWMPERMRGIATTFATSNRGACHKRAPIGMELMGAVPMDSIEGRAALVADIQNRVNAVFTLVSCRFAEFTLPLSQFVDLLNSASGFDYTVEEFLRLGEVIWNLERIYNLNAGIDSSQDKLPDICFTPPPDLPADTKPLTRDDLKRLIADYYDIRGWTSDGIPTKEKLTSLGLE